MSQTPRPSSTSSPGTSAPPLVTIATARSRQGQRVTIAGTVTAPTTLLDADGRRVTIEDASGAILVRLLANEASPSVGTRLRITGEVGTYYGANQLGASDPATRLGSGPATPSSHASGPLGATDEWRLIRLLGSVDAVHRDGDGWRAELRIAGGTLVPIVGLARAGIPSTALVTGRTAAILGVVRPPYPTASDRRLVLIPRSGHDITLGAAAAAPSHSGTPATGPSSTSSGGTVPTGIPGSVTGSTAEPSAGTSVLRRDYDGPSDGAIDANGATVVTARLADLDGLVGRTVRVGGRVIAQAGTAAELEDDTGRAQLLWRGDAALLGASLPLGATVNVMGMVIRDGSARAAIVVAGPQDVSIAAALGRPAGEDAGGSGIPGSDPGIGVGLPAPSSAPGPAVSPDTLGRATSAAPGQRPADPAGGLLVLLFIAALGALVLGLVGRPGARGQLHDVRERTVARLRRRRPRDLPMPPVSTDGSASRARDPAARA